MTDALLPRRETITSRGDLLCPQCETGFLIARQCKCVCETCGYVESCEDNFLPTRETPAGELLHR